MDKLPKKQINIFLPLALYELMVVHKTQSGLSITGLIRLALYEYLQTKKKGNAN